MPRTPRSENTAGLQIGGTAAERRVVPSEAANNKRRRRCEQDELIRTGVTMNGCLSPLTVEASSTIAAQLDRLKILFWLSLLARPVEEIVGYRLPRGAAKIVQRATLTHVVPRRDILQLGHDF